MADLAVLFDLYPALAFSDSGPAPNFARDGGLCHRTGLTFAGVTFDAHTLLFASLALLCGFQAVVFAVFSKLFGITEGLLPSDPRLERAFNYITLEVGLAGGAVALIVGCGLLMAAVLVWRAAGWGRLDYSELMRLVIPGATFTALGFQAVLSSFFMSILGMKRK
jgi:hypothetical protein